MRTWKGRSAKLGRSCRLEYLYRFDVERSEGVCWRYHRALRTSPVLLFSYHFRVLLSIGGYRYGLSRFDRWYV